MAWFEFLWGPVSERHVELVAAVIAAPVIPISECLASSAAQLFTAIGRSRKQRTDTLVAACAMADGATLVTLNEADFQVFVPHGLALASV